MPGAGLGRLSFDIGNAGNYFVEANELSWHQMFAAEFVLYGTQQNKTTHRLYPWVLNFSNHLTRANQLRSIFIPDAHLPLGSSSKESTLMSAGDFCVRYKQPTKKDMFNAVTTCFFIDTAPNLITYIETLHHCLKPGGLWINLGPLLWHFEPATTPAERDRKHQHVGVLPIEDTQQKTSLSSGGPADRGIVEPGSFELSNDEVLLLLCKLGFEIVEQREIPAAGYVSDPLSMLQSVYSPTFWVAKKL